jgi:hypothetical protein
MSRRIDCRTCARRLTWEETSVEALPRRLAANCEFSHAEEPAMASTRVTPSDLARRLGEKGRARTREKSLWRRETYTLPRVEARAKAHEWFTSYPKAAYMTEIEFWRELADGQIEFTIRRLPSAD